MGREGMNRGRNLPPSLAHSSILNFFKLSWSNVVKLLECNLSERYE